MKLKELLKEANEENRSEKKEKALKLIKGSLKAVEEGRKTLKELEKDHEELLDTDLEDLESENWEY